MSAHASGPTIQQFFKIRTPGSPQFTPGGTLFVSDSPDGVTQIYRAKGNTARATDNKGDGSGDYARLTNFKDGSSGYSLSPDGKRMLVMAAVGGNENTQIHLYNTSEAVSPDNVKPLITNPKVQYAPNLWLPDSSGFLYTGNDQNPNDFSISRYDFATGKSSVVLSKPGSWGASGITRDQTRVLVSEYKSASDSRPFELQVSTGELKSIAPPLKEGETSAVEIVGYMPDEKSVLIVSDFQNGRNGLYQRDLGSPAIATPIPELAKYEIDGASMNLERTILAVVINNDGYGELRLFDLPSFKPLPLPKIDQGVVGIADLNNRQLVYSLSNAQSPALAYEYKIPEVGGSAGEARQVTFADNQGIDLAGMRLPTLVKYKSFDGVEIPAFVYLPANAGPGKPVPFVVNYHGGPEGQSRPGFSTTVQYLVAQGFGVMQPNVRGSSGYGREFLMMDDYKKRWDSVKDGVEAARWLVSQKYAKPGQIAAYGGSYGGYMTVACIVEDGHSATPVIGAGINVVGIVNVKTFLEQTSGYRRKLREVEYGPLSDPDFLASVSPIHKLDYIKVPMMIAHGLNDPRVPVGEAMQLAIALQKRGEDPELFFAPDEGHGFAKLDNRLLFNERMVKFLKTHIVK
ncbi:MAG: S9 family peptidase [Planctomycetota bacterium]|nr:S9 family peptidase [Planctomycetota bacterium]